MNSRIKDMQYTFYADEIRAIEKKLIMAGEPLMQQASFGLSTAILRSIRAAGERISGTSVLVLAGKGNNGADALYAGANLARRGLNVYVVVSDEVSEVALSQAECANTVILRNPSEKDLQKIARKCEIWVDGIFGIGLKGKMREPFATWLNVLAAQLEEVLEEVKGESATRLVGSRNFWSAKLNNEAKVTKPKIFAVDIPSGIEADSGDLLGTVLPADITVTMGCLKRALLSPSAMPFCGEIVLIDLGFERVLNTSNNVPAISATFPSLCRVNEDDLRDVIFFPQETDHKYSRGVLNVNTGSAEYPGAGVLSVGAALCTGVGMLRYLGEAVEQVRSAYPEVVAQNGSADAWLIGSGVVNLEMMQKSYQNAVAQKAVAILDAGAIQMLAVRRAETPTIITPHTGELAQFFQNFPDTVAVNTAEIIANPTKYAQIAAEKSGAVVVLKGSITVIATPDGDIFTQGPATPWLATAGSGDTLAGIIAALIANCVAVLVRKNGESNEINKVFGDGFALAKISAIGVLIHSLAAQKAANSIFSSAQCRILIEELGNGRNGRSERGGRIGRSEEMICVPQSRVSLGHPIKASDIINAISEVIFSILN